MTSRSSELRRAGLSRLRLPSMSYRQIGSVPFPFWFCPPGADSSRGCSRSALRPSQEVCGFRSVLWDERSFRLARSSVDLLIFVVAWTDSVLVSSGGRAVKRWRRGSWGRSPCSTVLGGISPNLRRGRLALDDGLATRLVPALERRPGRIPHSGSPSASLALSACSCSGHVVLGDRQNARVA